MIRNQKIWVPNLIRFFSAASPPPQKKAPPQKPAETPPKKPAEPQRKHGNLSDKDRIFTNIYRDQDPFIKGALKRVRFDEQMFVGRLVQNEGHFIVSSRFHH